MDVLTVKNPFDLSSIEELKMDSEECVEKALQGGAAIARDRKKWIPKERRIDILENFKKLLQRDRDKLITQAIEEGGKPRRDSTVEIQRGIEGVQVAIEELKMLSGREIPMNLSKSSEGRMAFTFHRPRGLVVAISAFNHPFNLIIHQVIPAIAAGCPVLVKPALMTPLSCRSIVELLYEAGLEASYARMVLCSNQGAEKLATHQATSFLSFIGSSKVGWFLRSSLPPGAHCALEHGGVAPVIIDETADIASCIGPLVKGAYYHGGQVCVSVQRIFIHRSKKEEFLHAFVREIEALDVGDPRREETDVGPLISPREVERVSLWVREALREGAHCPVGGKKLSETLYAPTVLVDVCKDSMIVKNEVFGPVAVVQAYDRFESAICEANDVEFAFQASIFTKDLDKALWAIQELEGLAIMVNDHTAFRVDWMPFGGYKKSGLGVGGIGHSLRDLTLEKMFVLRSPALL